jgi:hypothetical protein
VAHGRAGVSTGFVVTLVSWCNHLKYKEVAPRVAALKLP